MEENKPQDAQPQPTTESAGQETPLVDAVNESSLETPSTTGTAAEKEVKPTAKQNAKKKGMRFFALFVNRFNIYFLAFLFLILIAFAVIIFAVVNAKKDEKKSTSTITTQPLKDEDLKDLQGSETKIGDPKQLLSVEANAQFSGSVLVKGALDVAGPIKVGGSIDLPGITVSGKSSFDEVNANTLSVTGNASVAGALTVQRSMSVAGDATIGGTFTASKLNISNLEVNGNLSLSRHIDAGGPTPTAASGAAVGGGGTVSVSGTDTAGTVTVNTGSSAGTGVLANVTFSTAFSQAPHVVITPIGANAGGLGYYVTRTANGFSIGITNTAPSTTSFGFDYIVID